MPATLARPMHFSILTRRGTTEDKNPILMIKTYTRNYKNLELDRIILFTSSNTLLYTRSHWIHDTYLLSHSQ